MSAPGHRGAALVELALVSSLVPLLIAFCAYLTEAVRAKLKVQELARAAAWEMASHALCDFAQADHSAAFEIGRSAVLQDLGARYAALDAANPRAPARFGVAVEAPTLEIRSVEGPSREGSLPALDDSGVGEVAARAASLASSSLASLLRRWGLNAEGAVEVDSQVRLRSVLLPGAPPLSFKSRLSLVASGWNLLDGGDSVMRGARAGEHRAGRGPSGLYLQVKRMTFGGESDLLDTGAARGLERLLPSAALPSLAGTYVVSHNYGGPSTVPRGCNAPKHPAPSGLNNLARAARVDFDDLRCFDTMPFREVAKYDASLPVQMFRRRGPGFMGCPFLQADSPTSTSYATDEASERVPCGPS